MDKDNEKTNLGKARRFANTFIFVVDLMLMNVKEVSRKFIQNSWNIRRRMISTQNYLL